MSGATSGASAFGSRMPHTPEASGIAEREGAHDQRLAACPATTGSASCAPASASLRISGSGLISVFSGKKPETIVAGLDRERKRPRRDRLGGLRALGRRQRIAPHERVLADDGFQVGDGVGHLPSSPTKCRASHASLEGANSDVAMPEATLRSASG